MVYYTELDPKQIITFYDEKYRREGYHGKSYDEWMEDIKTKGVMVPVEIQFDGKEYKCIDGNMRVMISRDLGFDKIPCVILEVR